MPKIIKDNQIIDDNWIVVGIDEDKLAATNAQADIIVSFEFWETHKESLINRAGRIGVELLGEHEPEHIEDELDKVDLIAIHFPKFADGRGYSLARLLRERHNYTGELRATGDVLRDQLFYMQRCGFNSFALREDRDINEAVQSLQDFSVTYQADVHETRPVYHRR